MGFPTPAPETPKRGSPENASDLRWPPLSIGVPKIPDHDLLKLIGRGSYGEVWLARNIMGSYRAVKIVYRDSFTHERPYQREYEGIEKFEPISRRHESQLNILHIGRSDSLFYYVMELADDEHGDSADATGEKIKIETYAPRTLRSELNRRGALSHRECIELGLSLSTALIHLHKHNLVHRDIKPSNIVYVHGLPKLADIGLVSQFDATRSYVGTAGFAPLEGPGTPQADIFSLGKVLYEAATARDRQEFPELPTRLKGTEKEQQDLLELNQVLLKACDNDPRARYQTAEELHEDLLLLRSGESLIELRATQKRFARVRKIATAAAILGVLFGAAYLYQARQTRLVSTLAKRAEESAKTSQENLVRLQVENGLRHLDRNEPGRALLWFAHALKSVDSNSIAAADNRMRIGAILQHHPTPAIVYTSDLPTSYLSPAGHYSLDGRRLVIVEKTVHVLDANDGHTIGVFVPPHPVDSISSADGLRVVTHKGSTWQCWDAKTGEPIGNEIREPAGILFLTVSNDGNRVATASVDRRVRIYDLSSGTLLSTTGVHSNRLFAVEFSSDLSLIATGSGKERPVLRPGEARVWKTSTGLPVTDWIVHNETINTLRFSPDGQRLAIGGWRGDLAGNEGRREAKLLDARTGGLIRIMPHQDSILEIAFSPDSRLVAVAGGDHQVSIWNALNGEPANPRLQHERALRSIAFSPDGQYLATSTPDDVRIWDLAQGTTVAWLQEPVGSLRFNRDGSQLMVCSYMGHVTAWNLIPSQPRLPPIVSPTSQFISGANFSPDGKTVATLTFKGDVILEDVKSGAIHSSAINVTGPNVIGRLGFAPRFSPDGRFVVGLAIDNSLRLFDPIDARELTPPLEHSAMPWTVDISPDSQKIFTAAADGTIREWSAKTGRLTRMLAELGSPARLALSPDGTTFATQDLKNEVQLWKTETGARIGGKIQGSPMTLPKFSPSGKLLATWIDPEDDIEYLNRGSIVFWDTRTGERADDLHDLPEPATIQELNFSRDERRVLTALSSQRARLRKIETGGIVGSVMNHPKPVRSAKFSPDGSKIVTLCEDGTVRVFSAGSTGPIIAPLRPVGGASCVEFSPDGTQLVTSGPHCAEVWDLAATERSAELVQKRTEFLAMCSLDPVSGLFMNFSIKQLREACATWDATKDRPTLTEQLTWHKRQLVIAEKRENWFATEFHLRWIFEHDRNDPSALAVQARLREERTPERDATLPRELIDLTRYYNASTFFPWAGLLDNDLRDFPRGVYRFAGTRFDARGLIYVSRDDSFLGRPFPETVNAIQVGLKCRRIHFLHGALGGQAPTGTEIGRYTFHYANGVTKVIPLKYAEHLRDWWSHSEEPEEAMKSDIAWRGGNNAVRRQNQTLKLFATTFENDFPEVELTSIDVEAMHNNINPFVLAITVEP